ncbi:MAG: diguanylate cyclase [Desulfovibrionales bacterium]|nr:MAG: diguanylate cyclase [Desulfovibrionales bacterium]
MHSCFEGRFHSALSSDYLGIIQCVHDGIYIVDKKRHILFWNNGATRISGFQQDEVLGRSCGDNILNHVDASGENLCKAICPLGQTMIDGNTRNADVFLHSKQGHRVPVHVQTMPLIHDGEIIGAVEVFREIHKAVDIEEMMGLLSEQCLLDYLTGIANRRFIDITLDAKIKELERYSWPFSIALCDIDDFKTVNDTYGHLAGDDVLVMVSRSLTGALRSFDFVGRWGGEEFLVILPGITMQEQLESICRRMVRIVASSRIDTRESTSLSVTISCGATQALMCDTAETLMHRADKGLYASKRNGKNRVTIVA